MFFSARSIKLFPITNHLVAGFVALLQLGDGKSGRRKVFADMISAFRGFGFAR